MPFSPADAGALMRYADDLADCRVIPIAAVTVLQRLTFRYRPKGGRVACVGLEELAGDGMAKGTLCKLLDTLEQAFLIVREGWGIITGGRWRQMPNRYHIRTVDEAKAAAMKAADERGKPEREYPLFTVSLPPSESNSCTLCRVLDKESTSIVLPTPYARKEEEDAQGREPESTALAGAEAIGAGNPAGDGGRPAEHGAVEPGRPEADALGGGVSDRDSADAPEIPGEGRTNVGSVGQHPAYPGQGGGGGGRGIGAGGDGLSTDLLEARVRAVQARLLAGEKLTPAAPDQTSHRPLGALAARARAVQARMAEAYSARRSASQSQGWWRVRGSMTHPMATANSCASGCAKAPTSSATAGSRCEQAEPLIRREQGQPGAPVVVEPAPATFTSRIVRARKPGWQR